MARTVDRLSERRQVTVVLRLLLDPSGRLIRGEVVDATGTPRSRFSGWRGLTSAVRAALAGPDHGGTPARTSRAP